MGKLAAVAVAMTAFALSALSVAACTSSDETTGGGPATGATTTTSAPLVAATRTGERTVNPGYRQGVASLPDGGWIFSGTTVLARTDRDLV